MTRQPYLSYTRRHWFHQYRGQSHRLHCRGRVHFLTNLSKVFSKGKTHITCQRGKYGMLLPDWKTSAPETQHDSRIERGRIALHKSGFEPDVNPFMRALLLLFRLGLFVVDNACGDTGHPLAVKQKMADFRRPWKDLVGSWSILDHYRG